MSEYISLFELLNLSIGTPQRGFVNFSALHALLHAMLSHLDLQEAKTRWGDPDGLMGVTALSLQHRDEEENRDQEEQGDQDDQEDQLPASSSSSTGPADQRRLRSRIKTCEDGVSRAMQLIQELHHQKDNLKEEIKELHQQQKIVGAPTETVAAVETCCRRVDALDQSVRSLRDTFHKYPDPEGQCVTWDVLQSTLLSERHSLQKEAAGSGVVDPARVVKNTSTPSSLHPVDDTGRPSAPSSPTISGQISSLGKVTDAGPPTEVSPVLSEQTKTGRAAAGTAAASERYPETMEALRNVGRLTERFSNLEARVAALEDGKVDQSQLTHLREVLTDRDSQDASISLRTQQNQQRALIDSLMSEREKPDSLEDMCENLSSQDGETATASESVDSDRASHELRQQISYLRRSVQRLEEDVKQLKAKQVLSGERTNQHLQDQLDDLHAMLEDMILSLTSQLSIDLQDEAGQDESDSQGVAQSKDRSALTAGAVNVVRKLSLVFQHYEQLQDKVNRLLQQQTEGRAGPLMDTENVELVNDVQRAILQLQAECEKLHDITRCLDENNREKQSHIEELYKTMQELEERKADKQMVESEIKADKSALDSKVSRLQFDSVTEQLNTMFHELLNKVTGQEQDWHKVIDRLSTEMECKLNRIELESVKKQLEDRWKNIQGRLQAQGAPDHDDAAGLRKQLVDRFHCLSCDRPVNYNPASHLVKLPSTPGFPAHKSIRPFTVYALEQFRQHYRSLKLGPHHYKSELVNSRRRGNLLQENHHTSNLIQNQPRVQHERISELTDYSQLAVSRSCGGSHTIISASQRRTSLHCMKHHTQTEADARTQLVEADIVGVDGHIYKGRLNTSAIKNTETKLPTISTKDGMCKTKDKAKCTLSHKPAASPDVGHGALPHHSAKSAQCSRSASSSSGRDWPVSALGCTSQSSFTQASAAADSNTEPPTEEPVNL